jgi:hypothetical protein
MKWIGVSALFVAIGCGGSAPQTQPATPEGAAGAGAVAGGPAGTPDLSPVAAPAELFMVGRLANPAKVVDTIAGWSKLPIDWRQLLAKEEPGLERVVYLDAPVEFAVALDPNGSGQFPQPLAVVSIGLTSLQGAVDFARQKGEPVRQVRAGIYRVGASGDTCAIAASVGKAPARLVCGERPEDVDGLLPYVTRGLPSEQLGAGDFYTELRAEPIRRRHGRELRQLKLLAPFAVRDFSLDNARFDRALKDAAHGIAEELIAIAEDLDTVTVDATIKGDNIESSWKVRLRSASSWSAQTLAAAGQRSGAPSETFWKLPADADSASFAVGMEPKRYEAIRRTLAELLDGWLEHERVPRRVRDDLVDLIEEAFKTEGASAYASGSLPFVKGGASDADFARQAARATVGWHILAIQDKPDVYKKYLGNVVRSYNDPQFRQLLEKRLGVKPKEIPKLSTRGARGLPAGSTAYELSIPVEAFDGGPPPPGAKKPPPGKPITFVLVVVPQGQTTWLGLSADEKVLVDKLNGALKGAADKSLASRPGLAPLKTTSAVSGGFLSIASFLGGMQSWFWRMRGDDQTDQVFAAMPNRGRSAMTHVATVKREGKGVVAEWKVQIPKGVIEDAAAAGPAMAASAVGPIAPPPPVMAPVPPPPPPPPAKPRKAPRPVP